MRTPSRFLFFGITFLVLSAFYFVLTHGPIRNGIHQARESPQLQTLHAIGLAMYSYANDHGNNYPDGNSSTEVFQKLLDGGYVTRADLFYLPAAGKAGPIAGQKLKPENVCFDVTSGVSLNSPGTLPLVFLSGFKVTYAPGGSAVAVIKPYPQFGGDAVRTWTQWWYGEPAPGQMCPGIVVFYLNNTAAAKRLSLAPDGARFVPDFVPSYFKSDRKTYRQLTPDGVLPP